MAPKIRRSLCAFVIAAHSLLLCTCMWAPGNGSGSDDEQTDSFCLLVDTVAFLEPEIPSFSDSVLADVSLCLAAHDSAGVVALLDSACARLTVPAQADSSFMAEEYSQEIIAFMDSNRYEFNLLKVDIERFRRSLRQMFP